MTTVKRIAIAAATAVAAVGTLGPRAARACGVSTADGVYACSLQEHEEETRPRWLAGASAIYTSTANPVLGRSAR